MIELSAVSVVVPTYPGTRTLLDGIDLALVEPRIAIVGLNGSGKSTLLRLFNGLVEPTSGHVRVEGLDTVTQAREVRRMVGFVFTDALAQLLMPTAVEDVELSLRRTVPRSQRRARALELLAQRGLERVAHSSVHDLSGGERQLVALTSVLAVEPAIVVADEPTTLLDLRNREHVRRALAALPQQVIIATHDLDIAAGMDRVIVIDEGRVVADGDPKTAVPAYRDLVGHG